MKRALIFGIGGQDGSYLADILLREGYSVHGIYRRSSVDNLQRIRYLIDCPDCEDRLFLHQGDLTDPLSLVRCLKSASPYEVYNMADQDHVGWSYRTVAQSIDITAGAVARLMEMIRLVCPEVKIFQPVSATMFGNEPPCQHERTRFDPLSPYACAKVAAYYICQYYRKIYRLNIITGIMFNHDSPRRGGDYLLHKICRGVVAVKRGKAPSLKMGNLDLQVDIGYAKEYMEAVYSLMCLGDPDDYVVGTGTGYTIGDLVSRAFGIAGLNLKENPDMLEDDHYTPQAPTHEKTIGGKSIPPSTLIANTWKLQKAIGDQTIVSDSLNLVESLMHHYEFDVPS